MRRGKRLLGDGAVAIAILAALSLILPTASAETAIESATPSSAVVENGGDNSSLPSDEVGDVIPVAPVDLSQPGNESLPTDDALPSEDELPESASSDVSSGQIWMYRDENFSVGPGSGSSILWTQSTHRNIATEVLSTSSVVDSAFWDILISSCDDPDNWWIDKPYHYADWGACARVKQYADSAVNYFNAGDMTTGYQRLGWTSHYLMDVGNPYHSQLIFMDLGVHFLFEQWISDHWTDPAYMLVNEVRYKGTTDRMIYSDDVEELASWLVSYVSDWETVFTLYLTTGLCFDWFLTGVRYCLAQTAEFLATLYEYVGSRIFSDDFSHEYRSFARP